MAFGAAPVSLLPCPEDFFSHAPALPPHLVQAVYESIDKQMSDPASGLKGTLFWQWYDDGQLAPASEDGGRGLFGEWLMHGAAMQFCAVAAAGAGSKKQQAGCWACLATSCLPPNTYTFPACLVLILFSALFSFSFSFSFFFFFSFRCVSRHLPVRRSLPTHPGQRAAGAKAQPGLCARLRAGEPQGRHSRCPRLQADVGQWHRRHR